MTFVSRVVLTACLTAGAGLALIAATTAGQATQTPAVRQIPGLTTKDAFPNGCVDCHIVTKDGDQRLSTLMAAWVKSVPAALADKAKAASADASKIKGKHPGVPAKANVPQSCLSGCHKKGSTIAPPFAQLMHAVHLVGDAQNHFLTQFQDECTHCHKLDQKTGTWKVGTGSEK